MGVSSYNLGDDYAICTSTTRPAAPYVGLIIYETDTRYTKIWNGTVWKGTGFTRVPFAFVYRNAALSLTTATWTTITYDVATPLANDADDIHANGDFTVPSGWDGNWLFHVGISLPANATGRRIAGFTVNGGATEYNIAYTPNPGSGAGVAVVGTTIVTGLVAGDIVRARGYQDSGATLALNVGSYANTFAKFAFLAGT